MTTKNYYAVLPVLTASLLIPQLLFWWLAPLAAIARLTIYLGGTLITSAVIATLFVSYWKCGLRKTHDSRLRPGNGHKALPPRNR